MGQCRTLDADVTIGCYCGDYNSCDNTIPTSLYIWNTFFRFALVISIHRLSSSKTPIVNTWVACLF